MPRMIFIPTLRDKLRRDYISQTRIFIREPGEEFDRVLALWDTGGPPTNKMERLLFVAFQKVQDDVNAQ